MKISNQLIKLLNDRDSLLRNELDDESFLRSCIDYTTLSELIEQIDLEIEKIKNIVEFKRASWKY